MKIAILTLHLISNYGGILQAYALQTVLKNMGHEVITIRRKNTYRLPFWKMPFSYAKRILNKYILRKKGAMDIFYEQKKKAVLPIITCNTQPFIDKYIQMQDIAEVKKNKNYFDAFIVGSDQVWRPKYYGDIKEAYLSFAKNWEIKRIAYAASFGTNKWEYNLLQSKLCEKLVRKFDAVSVREGSGADLCKKQFGLNAVHVLDPTMLLNAEHYISLIEKANVEKSKGELFVYVLDKNEYIKNIEQQISAAFGYTPFYTSTDSYKATLEERIASKPEGWLRSFYDAEFVLTDSFHACAFSILFNKPFFVYGNEGRGLSRFSSLLKLFNLENRFVSSGTENWEQILNTPIDWDSVNEILEKQRGFSNRFLINALENAAELNVINNNPPLTTAKS